MAIKLLKWKKKEEERAIPDDSIVSVSLTTSLYDHHRKESCLTKASFIRLRPVSEYFTCNKVTKLSPSTDSIVFAKLAHLKKSLDTILFKKLAHLKKFTNPLRLHHLFELPMLPKTRNMKNEEAVKTEESVKINENIRNTFTRIKDKIKGYVITITERDVDVPYQLTPEMFERAEAVTKDCKTDEETAKALFDWLESEIEYGSSKRGVGYRNSKEVFEQKEGVCGEMAYTYITMARSLGLKAGYVSVEFDAQSNKVHHGCAYVSLNGRNVLVDIAYHTFDISHQKYAKLSDREAIRQFKSWR